MSDGWIPDIGAVTPDASALDAAVASAMTAAGTATTKAGEASDSADAAAGYAQAADTAKSGAETVYNTMDGRLKQIPGGSSFVVDDEDGNVLIEVTTDEIRHPAFQALEAATVGVLRAPDIPGPAGFEIADASGNVAFRSSASESAALLADAAKGRAAWDASLGQITPRLLADASMFISYGQSNGRGSPQGAISTSALTYADMIGTSPFPNATASLAGYREVTWESPLYGCFAMFKQLLDAASEDFTGQKLLGVNASEGGQDALALSSFASTGYFARIAAFMAGALPLYDALGDSVAPAVMLWTQGENDYTYGGTTSHATARGYAELSRQVRDDAEAALAGELGGSVRLPMLTWQVATHPYFSQTEPTVALGQLLLADDPDICLATPSWCLPFHTDNLHLTSIGARWLGAYYGYAAYRWLVDGVKVAPLVPQTALAAGNFAVLRFDVGDRQIVLDASFGATNYGLQLVDASGAAITVTGVSAIGRDRVRIEAASALSTGCRVRHAWSGNAYRGLGGIRDDSGDSVIFDPAGANNPLHRYAPIFETTLA